MAYVVDSRRTVNVGSPVAEEKKFPWGKVLTTAAGTIFSVIIAKA